MNVVDRSRASTLMRHLARIHGPDAREALRLTLLRMTPEARAALGYHWPLFARPKQLLPTDSWRVLLILAGRGWGKTRAVNEFVQRRAMEKPRRFLLIGRTEDEAVKILIKGSKSGLIDIAPPWFRPKFHASEPRRIEYPNGSVGYIATAAKPDGARGENLDFAVWDEIAAADPAYAAEMFYIVDHALRGDDPRFVCATTSRARVPILRSLVEKARKHPDRYRVISGNTVENRSNLARGFVDHLLAEYGGTKLERQEMGGELLDETDSDSLWQASDFRHVARPPCRLERVVVAVDPAISVRQHSDQTGLVAAGLGTDGNAYVLADESGKLADWPAELAKLCRKFGAHVVVAEINRGGNLVARAIRDAGVTVPVVEVNSQEAKEVRHDPVARLYKTRRFTDSAGVERVIEGRVYHAQGLDELERQQTTWHPHESKSPDRIDALVLAVDHLIGGDFAEFDADYVRANESFDDWNERPNVPGELRDTPRRDDDDDRRGDYSGTLGWNGGIG